MWSTVEREVNYQPHNTLASLRATISEVMANMDREVVIHPCKKFWVSNSGCCGGRCGIH
jgi:hypothetical protein